MVLSGGGVVIGVVVFSRGVVCCGGVISGSFFLAHFTFTFVSSKMFLQFGPVSELLITQLTLETCVSMKIMKMVQTLRVGERQ